jgi:hypothetical protein
MVIFNLVTQGALKISPSRQLENSDGAKTSGFNLPFNRFSIWAGELTIAVEAASIPQVFVVIIR